VVYGVLACVACLGKVSLLDLVSRSRGSVLLVSSAAVDEPPTAWPHYVAMKAAAVVRKLIHAGLS
jgi:hypothetical protein